MRQHLKYASLFLLGATVIACGGTTASPEDTRIRVLTTIYPLEYIASRVGGSDADVQSLIGPGSEAHAFEPTTSDVQRLSEAQLIVANGLDLEPWLARVISGLSTDRRPIVVEAADIEGLEVHEDGEEHDDEHENENGHEDEHEDEHEGEDGHDHEIDPHVWLDPVLAQRQVERIKDALIELDPDNVDGYTSRAGELIADMAALHDEYTLSLAGCAHNHFVTTHAAYGYLADRYGLEQISISGINLEAEPTPRDLAELTERVEELGLTHVLAEPSLSSRLAETVAAESSLELLPIHQMESVTAAELEQHTDYLGLMRDNLESLRTALGCKG